MNSRSNGPLRFELGRVIKSPDNFMIPCICVGFIVYLIIVSATFSGWSGSSSWDGYGVWYDLSRYPWAASIRNSDMQFCIGTMLNSTTMVTAASCTPQTINASYTVVVPATNISYTIISTKIHEQYGIPNGTIFQNDIAMWTLATNDTKAASLSEIKVQLDNGTYSSEGSVVKFVQLNSDINYYGSYLSRSSIYYPTVTEVRVIAQSTCQKFYPNTTSTVLCTGYDCHISDPGMPLFVEGANDTTILVGIATTGNCMDPQIFSLGMNYYAKISELAGWIQG